MNDGVGWVDDEPIVYVVDDDESMREAVEMLLRSVGFNVKTFASAEDFLALPMMDQPACLVIDVRLKGQSGLVVQERYSAHQVRIPIIFMTGHGDIAMSVRAMKAGAADFLTKPFRDQDMLDAVACALESDRQRRAADHSFDDLRRCYATLTPREREVMQLIVKGLRNKQIAAELRLSEITVKIHRNQAMKKMQSRSLAEFVLKGGALGIEAELAFPLQQKLMQK
ncbi:response regulator transcription factor [Paraburkholderia humisilvae]|nr:response regulator transcription factor [Paraburkholderia humisilvae]